MNNTLNVKEIENRLHKEQMNLKLNFENERVYLQELKISKFEAKKGLSK